MVPATHAVSKLLHAWSDGEPEAFQKLIPLVYDELHRLARQLRGSRTPRPDPSDYRLGQ